MLRQHGGDAKALLRSLIDEHGPELPPPPAAAGRHQHDQEQENKQHHQQQDQQQQEENKHPQNRQQQHHQNKQQQPNNKSPSRVNSASGGAAGGGATATSSRSREDSRDVYSENNDTTGSMRSHVVAAQDAVFAEILEAKQRKTVHQAQLQLDELAAGKLRFEEELKEQERLLRQSRHDYVAGKEEEDLLIHRRRVVTVNNEEEDDVNSMMSTASIRAQEKVWI